MLPADPRRPNVLEKIESMKLRRLPSEIAFRWNSLTAHPLTRDDKVGALRRYAGFHLRRILGKVPGVYAYVNDLRVHGHREAGITGVVFTGLPDFEEMGLLLHFLREGDGFVDVGANVGAYTLLAAGVCGAEVVAVEPIPETFRRLGMNLRLNGLEDRVRALDCGLGDGHARLDFRRDLGSMNRISIAGSGEENCVSVEVFTLGEIMEARDAPAMLKIDVEGYEFQVLRGGVAILDDPRLKVVVIELNGSGLRFGHADEEVHDILVAKGFLPHDYDPFGRSVAPLEIFHRDRHNTIYLRDLDSILPRLAGAPRFEVLGRRI